MYRLMTVISTLIRQFCIANPFDALGDGVVINIEHTPILLTPGVLNWVVEPFLHVVTFLKDWFYTDKYLLNGWKGEKH